MNEQLPSLWKDMFFFKKNGLGKQTNLESDKNAKRNKINDYVIEGKTLFAHKQWDKAIKSFIHGLEKDPSNIEIHYFLGLLYTKTNNFDKALVHFSELINSPYKYIHNRNVDSILAYIYSMQEDFETAFEYTKKALKSNKNDIKALSIMAFIYYKRKNYERAEEIYNSIIKLDTNNPNSYNSLGVIQIETEKDIDKGIELCKKALKLSPNNAAYLDSIGWGYYKNKKEKEAIKYLKQAFQIAPSNKEIKNHLKALLDI